MRIPLSVDYTSRAAEGWALLPSSLMPTFWALADSKPVKKSVNSKAALFIFNIFMKPKAFLTMMYDGKTPLSSQFSSSIKVLPGQVGAGLLAGK
jgi:hypothetical protein